MKRTLSHHFFWLLAITGLVETFFQFLHPFSLLSLLFCCFLVFFVCLSMSGSSFFCKCFVRSSSLLAFRSLLLFLFFSLPRYSWTVVWLQGRAKVSCVSSHRSQSSWASSRRTSCRWCCWRWCNCNIRPNSSNRSSESTTTAVIVWQWRRSGN